MIYQVLELLYVSPTSSKWFPGAFSKETELKYAKYLHKYILME